VLLLRRCGRLVAVAAGTASAYTFACFHQLRQVICFELEGYQLAVDVTHSGAPDVAGEVALLTKGRRHATLGTGPLRYVDDGLAALRVDVRVGLHEPEQRQDFIPVIQYLTARRAGRC